MTEPDDRPGSDDPEDPSELQRLIGRTVPRSPHASARPTTAGHASTAPAPAPGPEPGRPRPDGADADGPDTAAPATTSAERVGSGPEDIGVEDPGGAEDERPGPEDIGFEGPEGAENHRPGPQDIEFEGDPDGVEDERPGPVDIRFEDPAGAGPERAGPEDIEFDDAEDEHPWPGDIGFAPGADEPGRVGTEPGPAGPGVDGAQAGPAAPIELDPPIEPDAAAAEPGAAGPDPAAAAERDEPAEDPVDEQLPPDELADDTDLEHALEALLLVVDSPVDEASLAATLDQPTSRIRTTLNRMSLAYTADARGIDLRRAGEGWRFYTRDRYAPYVEKMLLDGQRARLTRAALETLAVVAYRQPVTRARVSAVRGVNCDGVLRTLLTRGLVEEAGAEEQTGGTLFRTTELFLERLGLSSVAELPPLAPLLPDIDAIDDLDGSWNA